MPKPILTPTAEQEAILTAARETSASIFVEAYAGCGKTTTLTMIANALPAQPCLALAFNVKIKKELEKRFPDYFAVLTLNGLGHKAWGRTINRRCEVDTKKLGRHITAIMQQNGYTDSDLWFESRDLVTAAMNAGLVPSGFPYKGLVPDIQDAWADIADDIGLRPSQTLLSVARAVLTASVKESFKGVISYEDQIYMPTMFGGTFPRFGLVMVDEAQDLSPLNHIQVKRTAGDRLIIVGDAKQAIYAFRGADSASIQKLLALRPNWVQLPLHTTFRCGQVIVQNVQDHAPGFIAAPGNPKGQIVNVSSWNWNDIKKLSTGTIAVLCRNNAPLMKMALRLIGKGVRCVVAGRDLLSGIQKLCKELFQEKLPSNMAQDIVRNWAEGEISLALANNKDHKADLIIDKRDCILALLEHCAVTSQLHTTLEKIFDDSDANNKVVLSSGHKAKGLEWDTVVHLDPDLIPSRYAVRSKNAEALRQEYNLRYVIETRAKSTLIYVYTDKYNG